MGTEDRMCANLSQVIQQELSLILDRRAAVGLKKFDAATTATLAEATPSAPAAAVSPEDVFRRVESLKLVRFALCGPARGPRISASVSSMRFIAAAFCAT